MRFPATPDKRGWRTGMLLLLMLGCIVRPALGLLGDVHQRQHGLLTTCDAHVEGSHPHASQQPDCRMGVDGASPAIDLAAAENAPPPDPVDGPHAALFHQANVGFVAALPALPDVLAAPILIAAPPAPARTALLPQPASSPFRPPIHSPISACT